MQTISMPQAVLTLTKHLLDSKYESYLVGGCVRDFLLNKEPHDWDMTTNATPEQIIQCLKQHHIPYLTIGEKHGTITAIVDGENYEITTYRSDGNYSDGRHPDTVIFETNLTTDLARRDFTINAIAYNPITNEIVDPYNGKKDLKNKVLRCVGKPDARFQEDGLRILRALRFAIKYGLNIEYNTFLAIHQKINCLQAISKERITEEFRKIFNCNQPVLPIFSQYNDIISYLIPSLKPCVNFNQHSKYHQHDVYTHILSVIDGCDTNDFVIKMAALLHDIGKPNTYSVDEEGWGHFYGHPEVSYNISKEVLAKDFRLSNNEIEEILSLIYHHDMYMVETNSSVKKALNILGYDTFNKWVILRESDRADHINLDKLRPPIDLVKLKNIADNIIASETCFQLKDLAINGTDLMNELHMKPGKQVGHILNCLLVDVLNDTLPNEKEELVQAAIHYALAYNKDDECIER